MVESLPAQGQPRIYEHLKLKEFRFPRRFLLA